jgi:hypothetical protein
VKEAVSDHASGCTLSLKLDLKPFPQAKKGKAAITADPEC